MTLAPPNEVRLQENARESREAAQWHKREAARHRRESRRRMEEHRRYVARLADIGIAYVEASSHIEKGSQSDERPAPDRRTD